jgi:hypothetical protein
MPVAQGIAKQVKAVKQTALGVPGSAGSSLVRRLTATFNLERDTYASNEIASHQQSTGATAGIGKTSGKLNCEISAGTYANFWAALLRKDMAATTPMSAVGITISGSAPAWTVTRTAGSWLTDGLKAGDVIRLSAGALNAANISKNLIVSSITSATAITVVPLNGVALVNEGPITGCTVTVVGKKTRVPTSGHTNDYFSVEQWFADLNKSELFTDVKVAMADVALPATGIATVNFDMPGLGRTTGNAEVLTSPSPETGTSILSAVAGKVIIGGAVTSVTGAQLQITGNIQAGEAEMGSNAISDHQRGRVAVTGSFTAKFSSTVLQDLFNSQASAHLILVAAANNTAASDFVGFSMSNVKIFSDGADDGEKEIIRTYSFTAAINGAGGAALANDQTIISIQDSAAA